jgi:hypothetical protein
MRQSEKKFYHLMKKNLHCAMRYFDAKHHAELVPEFKEELATYGRIYIIVCVLINRNGTCNRRIS